MDMAGGSSHPLVPERECSPDGAGKSARGRMSAERAGAYACIQAVARTGQLRGISCHRLLQASMVFCSQTGKPMSLAAYQAALNLAAIAA